MLAVTQFENQTEFREVVFKEILTQLGLLQLYAYNLVFAYLFYDQMSYKLYFTG